MSVSVVIPCLNEEGSLEECLTLVKRAFETEPRLEILVVDNGSTDRSKQIALRCGARVVDESKRGYGAALMRGLKEAQGEFVVFGDADNTYDFRDGFKLVQQLRSGADFAIGDRINGEVDDGAMPWLHRKFGTPALTWTLNQFFGSRVHDINCGLRAIRKDCIDRLRLRSPGMEFASEMVIHAQKAGLKFAEIPIHYYKRHHGQAKLRTFRDGWRHLRFILLCAPFAVFFVPAMLGTLASIWFYNSERFGFQVTASLLNVVSFQVLVFGVMAKAILWVSDEFMVDQKFGHWLSRFRLEYGILLSLVLGFVGVMLFKAMDLTNLIRGSTFIALGVQSFFSSFLLSTIMFKRHESV